MCDHGILTWTTKFCLTNQNKVSLSWSYPSRGEVWISADRKPVTIVAKLSILILTALLATLLDLILWYGRSLSYRNHMVGTYVKPIYVDKQEDQTNSNFTGYLHGSYRSWQFLTSPCLHIVPNAQRSFTRILSRTGLKTNITRTITTKRRSLEHNEGTFAEFALSLNIYKANIGSFL